MYPDILITCGAPEDGLMPYTLQSIAKYAMDCNIILDVGPKININTLGPLLELRWKTLNKSKNDWVIFFDSDDCFCNNIPSKNILEPNKYDVHLYPVFNLFSRDLIYPVRTKDQISDLSYIFGFHMAICKRQLAIDIFAKWRNTKVYRDDICFLYGILKMTDKIKYHEDPIMVKMHSTMVKKNNAKIDYGEDTKRWQDRFNKLFIND